MNLLLLFGGFVVLFVAGFEIGARWAHERAVLASRREMEAFIDSYTAGVEAPMSRDSTYQIPGIGM